MSSKKKITQSECYSCGAQFAPKDVARHADECGKVEPGMSSVPLLLPFKLLRGFSATTEKFAEFLPPDSIGWTRAYSVLLNPQTLGSLASSRSPVLVDTPSGAVVAVLWPCVSVPPFRISTRFMLSDRMVTVRPLSVSPVCSLSLRVSSSPSIVLQEYLKAFLSGGYLIPGLPFDISFYGQKLRVEAQTDVEANLSSLSLDHSPKALSISSSCSIRVEGVRGEDKPPTFDEIGGLDDVKHTIRTRLIEPLQRGGETCNIVLWGLPGTGKSLLVRATAACLQDTLLVESLDELAHVSAFISQNTVLLLDLSQSSLPREHKSWSVLSRAVSGGARAVLLSLRHVDDLDLGIRCRLPLELEVPVPNELERRHILEMLTKRNAVKKEDLEAVARETHGFTGCDLRGLLQSAASEKGDFVERVSKARVHARPTGLRQFILQVPNVHWTDIGGNEELKLEIQQAVIWPQKHAESFERLGVEAPAGILLYGPPGCSKTLVARALATESKRNFLSVKGPELFSKWVGESERAVRELFSRARQVAPAIVFFDEIDAVGASRAASSGSSGVSERVLAQLLTELDGLERKGGVTVLAATNRPDQLDAALLRPGRLDRAIHVPLPDDKTRRAILERRLARMAVDDVRSLPSASTVQANVDDLVAMTVGFSGAEVEALCKNAALIAMREDVASSRVLARHFAQARTIVLPRTPASLLQIYEDFSRGRTCL